MRKQKLAAGFSPVLAGRERTCLSICYALDLCLRAHELTFPMTLLKSFSSVIPSAATSARRGARVPPAPNLSGSLIGRGLLFTNWTPQIRILPRTGHPKQLIALYYRPPKML